MITKMRILYFVIVLFLFNSCGKGRQLAAPPYYNSPKAIDTNNLRYDGYFTKISGSNYTQQKYTAVTPVLFTKNNKIHTIHRAYVLTDSALFKCETYEQMNFEDFGVYIINGNQIQAFCPAHLALGGGALYRTYYLNFVGTISNRELIVDWHAVPPYPKRVKKSDIENSQNAGFFKPHDLRFVQTDAIKCLDITK